MEQAQKPQTPEEFFAQYERQAAVAQNEGANEEGTQEPIAAETQAETAARAEPQAQEQAPVAEQATAPVEPPEVAALKAEIESLKHLVGVMSRQLLEQRQEQRPAAQPIPKETVDEILKSLPKETLEQLEQLYYEEPVKATMQASLLVNAIWQQRMMEEARRREQERQRQQEALEREFAVAAKELQDVHGVDEAALNEIADIMLKEKRELLSLPPRQAMRDAYEIWKRKKGVNEVQTAIVQTLPKALAEALKDPQVLGTVVQAIRPEVVKGAAEANAQVPVLIANQPGGVPPAAAPEKPKSVREAGRLWMMKEGIGA